MKKLVFIFSILATLATAQTVITGATITGTQINPWPAPIGTILNDNFNRYSVGPDYDVSSMVNPPTLNGSYMSLTGDISGNNTDQSIRFLYPMAFEEWYMSVNWTFSNALSTTKRGLALGTYTFSTLQTGMYDVYDYWTIKSGTNNLKHDLYIGNGASTRVNAAFTVRNSGSNMTPVVGHSYKTELTRTLSTSGATYTGVITDITGGTSTTTTWTENIAYPPLSPPAVAHRTAYPCIYYLGGTIDITNFTFSTTILKYTKILFVGNSITHGLYANDITNRFANQVETATGYSVQTNGGPGDVTADLLAKVENIIDYQPDVIIVFVGTNDIAAGLIATAQTNYPAAISAIKAGLPQARIIHVNALPRIGLTAINTWNTWLNTTYSGIDTVIDVNTPTNNGSNNMSGTYNSGDNVHPSQAGHDLIASLILAAL